MAAAKAGCSEEFILERKALLFLSIKRGPIQMVGCAAHHRDARSKKLLLIWGMGAGLPNAHPPDSKGLFGSFSVTAQVPYLDLVKL
jgi:hypothetical protein